MKKIHGEKSMKILNKGRICTCICMVLPHLPHPNSGSHSNKTIKFSNVNFFNTNTLKYLNV